jgi:small-conductance mechanosensitive channel
MKAVIFSLFRKLVSMFRKLFSLLRKLIQKLWLLPPCKKLGYVFQKVWKGNKPLEYHFLPYVTSVLRVLGWAVLVVGVIASIVLGLQIMKSGLMVWQIELIGAGPGVCVIVLGIIGSFLAWLFLLVNRELIYLFIHLKENTGSTAERITKEPD